MTSPDLSGAGIPGGRARLQRDGHRGVSAAGRAVPGTDRGDRLRAAGHPGGHPAHGAASSNGASTSWRTRTRRVVPAEGNPAARALLEDVFQVTDRGWRGIGVIPDSGWRLSEKYREFDAEYRFEVTRHRHRGVDGMPERRGAAGLDQTARVRGLRQGVHAAQSARGDHGLQRGSLRGLLPVSPAHPLDPDPRPASQGGGAVSELLNRGEQAGSTSRAGPARSRCGTARTS